MQKKAAYDLSSFGFFQRSGYVKLLRLHPLTISGIQMAPLSLMSEYNFFALVTTDNVVCCALIRMFCAGFRSLWHLLVMY